MARKVRVSIAALMARINRKLAHEQKQMKKSRSKRAWSDLGDYYVLNLNRNLIVATHCDPEEWARNMGVLEAYEELDA